MRDLLIRCPNCRRDVRVPDDVNWHATIVHSSDDQPPQRVMRDHYGQVLHTCVVKLKLPETSDA